MQVGKSRNKRIKITDEAAHQDKETDLYHKPPETNVYQRVQLSLNHCKYKSF